MVRKCVTLIWFYNFLLVSHRYTHKHKGKHYYSNIGLIVWRNSFHMCIGDFFFNKCFGSNVSKWEISFLVFSVGFWLSNFYSISIPFRAQRRFLIIFIEQHVNMFDRSRLFTSVRLMTITACYKCSWFLDRQHVFVFCTFICIHWYFLL